MHNIQHKFHLWICIDLKHRQKGILKKADFHKNAAKFHACLLEQQSSVSSTIFFFLILQSEQGKHVFLFLNLK